MRALWYRLNPKAKMAAKIAISVLAAIMICLIFFLASGTASISREAKISVEPYDEELIAGKEISGCFSETFFSKKEHPQLSKGKAVKIDDRYDFRSFVKDYRTIYSVNPPMATAGIERYMDGFVGIAVALPEGSEAQQFYASCKYTDDKTCVVVMETQDANPQYEYTLPLSECKQVIGIVYLKEELLLSVREVIILLP